MGWGGIFWGVLRKERFCDRNLVLGWAGLEIDGLGGSTPATKSNFYLFLS